mgnify:CR=1 FL=1
MSNHIDVHAAQETDRLAVLRSLDLFGTPPEERFDRITRIACEIFGVPAAFITLIDEHNWTIKSPQMPPGRAELPREDTLCDHTIRSSEMLIVPDATKDERFADLDLVTSSQIRFYAAFLFQELRDPRSLRPLAAHAFDPDPDVRLIATRVLESYSRVPGFVEATEGVRAELRSRDRDRVLLAAEAAGTLRDTHAVPVLIDLLSMRDKQVRETVLESLCSITAKHHGYRPAKWKSWYAENGQQTRLEWVIDALHHRDTAVRRWASDELVRITGHRIPALPDGEKPGAKYVLAQWQAWFAANGSNYP